MAFDYWGPQYVLRIPRRPLNLEFDTKIETPRRKNQSILCWIRLAINHCRKSRKLSCTHIEQTRMDEGRNKESRWIRNGYVGRADKEEQKQVFLSNLSALINDHFISLLYQFPSSGRRWTSCSLSLPYSPPPLDGRMDGQAHLCNAVVLVVKNNIIRTFSTCVCSYITYNKYIVLARQSSPDE